MINLSSSCWLKEDSQKKIGEKFLGLSARNYTKMTQSEDLTTNPLVVAISHREDPRQIIIRGCRSGEIFIITDHPIVARDRQSTTNRSSPLSFTLRSL